MLAVSCQGFGNLIQFMMPASRRRSTCSPCLALLCFALLSQGGAAPRVHAPGACERVVSRLRSVGLFICGPGLQLSEQHCDSETGSNSVLVRVFNARTFSHKWRGWGPPGGGGARGSEENHNRTTQPHALGLGDLEKHDEEILVTSIYWFTLPIIRAINNTRH